LEMFSSLELPGRVSKVSPLHDEVGVFSMC
jgi:hypothetical protein